MNNCNCNCSTSEYSDHSFSCPFYIDGKRAARRFFIDTQQAPTYAELQAQIGALSLFNALGQKLVKRIQDASAEGDNTTDVELRLMAIIAERDALKTWQESDRYSINKYLDNDGSRGRYDVTELAAAHKYFCNLLAIAAQSRPQPTEVKS